MSDGPEEYIAKLLARIQHNRTLRLSLLGASLAGLIGLGVYFLLGLLPHTYALSITGGSITGNRHYLAKVLQEEAGAYGIQLHITPTDGSYEALEMVNSGKLDLAFVQGGLQGRYPNVQHVATIGAELVHFFVKPGIEQMTDLRGKTINVGPAHDGTQMVADQILTFSGMSAGVDYMQSFYTNEALVDMRPDKLPDVIVNLSFAPSYLGDFLVRERGYRVLEVPFPAALTNRLAWVADKEILAYMYDVIPPVPDHDIHTVGVNLHLVANTSVDTRAIMQTLEALYGPSVESRLRTKLNESDLTTPSGYPLAEGSVEFLNRNNPLFSADTSFFIESLIGLTMTFLSVVLVIIKWFRGPIAAAETDDGKFRAYLVEVAEIERSVADMESNSTIRVDDLAAVATRLTMLKAEALQSYSTAILTDPAIIGTLIGTVDTARAHIDQLRIIFREA
jgi:TRAP-type uncharacterized transport system substrate-binding protein